MINRKQVSVFFPASRAVVHPEEPLTRIVLPGSAKRKARAILMTSQPESAPNHPTSETLAGAEYPLACGTSTDPKRSEAKGPMVPIFETDEPGASDRSSEYAWWELGDDEDFDPDLVPSSHRLEAYAHARAYSGANL